MSIDVAVDGGIALVTLNRPERMNALDPEHYQALSEAWVRVRDDPAIRVAVVTGAGEKAFTAGADLRAARKESVSDVWLTQRDQLLNRGLEVWKPVIAAVNGYCIGGGMTLLLATDIRVAARHATFGVAEVKRGIIPGNGGTQRLLRQLPYAIAMELLLTGDTIDAETAARWGLVNRVVDAKDVLDTAFEYAKRLAQNGPLALQAAKELAIRSLGMNLADGLRLEVAMGRILRSTADAAEGRKAFAEKRPPQFKGE